MRNHLERRGYRGYEVEQKSYIVQILDSRTNNYIEHNYEVYTNMR